MNYGIATMNFLICLIDMRFCYLSSASIFTAGISLPPYMVVRFEAVHVFVEWSNLSGTKIFQCNLKYVYVYVCKDERKGNL